MSSARPDTLSHPKPIVLVPACHRELAGHPSHTVGQKYVDAVRLAGALPLVVPSSRPDEIDELLSHAHGIFLTGSPSNVHPRHFDEDVHNPSLPLDPQRDDWTLPLIPKALALGMPLFAICRGFQEANVALGGSLHQAVQEQPGLNDHRAPEGLAPEQAYADVHPVSIEPGGVLAGLIRQPSIQVNSLHGQGVKRLAPGLRVEALAPDGLIEAFSVPSSPGFALCVQWHPEWQAAHNPHSMAMLQAFGQACRDYQARIGAARHGAKRDPDS